MTNGTETSGTGYVAPVITPTVNFRIVREIPRHLIPQIEGAIRGFMSDSHMARGVDPDGFYEHTLQSFASATYLGTPGHELWLGTLNEAIVSYVMATVLREVDNRLTYWVSQAWVRPDQRRKAWVKEAWQKIRTRAKDTFCSHMIVVSSRNDEAYCRWLGQGWHRYGGLLKEDLDGRIS